MSCCSDVMKPIEASSCCTPKDTAAHAARAMRDSGCGCTPVVEDGENLKLVGVVTERDVCCAVAADDRKASEVRLKQIMRPASACCGAIEPVEEARRKLDAQHGRSVGSHIVLRGRVFGFRLYLDEVMIMREPPLKKTWETVGQPRLLVIGSYRMGFELMPDGTSSRLRVAIDYELPAKGMPRLLGRLFGRSYAQWCTRRMVRDAQHSFAT